MAGHKPDVAVVDIRMPPTHTDEGLRAALRLRQDHPDTGVLVFSQYIETRYAARLLAGNAAGVGYLLKDRVADVAVFVAALTRVADGGTALDPEVVGQLFRASRHAAGLATLTRRERGVLALMAEGRSNAGISAALVISGGGGGEARGQYLRQAGAATVGGRQPARAGRAALPGRLRPGSGHP